MIVRVRLTAEQFRALVNFLASDRNIVYHPCDVTCMRQFAQILRVDGNSQKTNQKTSADRKKLLGNRNYFIDVDLEVLESISGSDEDCDAVCQSYDIPTNFLEELFRSLGKYPVVTKEEDSSFRRR